MSEFLKDILVACDMDALKTSMTHIELNRDKKNIGVNLKAEEDIINILQAVDESGCIHLGFPYGHGQSAKCTYVFGGPQGGDLSIYGEARGRLQV